MQDIKKLLAEATPPERSVLICLDGRLGAEIDEAERELEEAQRKPSESSMAGSPALAIARRIEDLQAQARERSVTFRVRGISRAQFTAMKAAHPPREGNTLDAQLGHNDQAFDEALARASVVEPELDDEDWAVLLGTEDRRGVLSSGQMDVLIGAAWWVNRRDVDVPFSSAASAILRNSAPA